jgi:hypothetical protein
MHVKYEEYYFHPLTLTRSSETSLMYFVAIIDPINEEKVKKLNKICILNTENHFHINEP